MDDAIQLNTLGCCLAGVFQNRQQALADPVWFVHLKIWIYPVAIFTEDSHTFFIEQASANLSQPPYRQRLLRVRWLANQLTAEYYALKQPQVFQGAAQATERLTMLTEADLQPLKGACLPVKYRADSQGTYFEARHSPGERCQFVINGEFRYVELGFDAVAPSARSQQAPAFLMYDKGLDPETTQSTWGALNGPFRLEKVEDFSSALKLQKT
ncbi:MAG: chromophore lyase CpcT/CpeT [Cyanobacteria bacterium P01_F01_bin.86]